MRTISPKVKPSKKESDKTKKQNVSEIPQNVLHDFVGRVPYLTQITACHLFDGHFRINAWTEEFLENRVVPEVHIAKSYFVYYDGKTITDKTIQPKVKKKGFFDD